MSRGSVDEPFNGEIKFRIEGEVLANESDSFSLSCLTYWSNRSSRASHNWLTDAQSRLERIPFASALDSARDA